ncbi:unnamed protein product, partial [Schistosoma turkestanicum]
HLLTLNHLDVEKFNYSSNGLHRTLLTGSALCLSNNSNTTIQQPKLLWSNSPRLNSISASKNATYHPHPHREHPTVDQLIPYLVRSAELFLSLADTSSGHDKSRQHSTTTTTTTTDNSEVNTTQLKNEKRQKSSVSYCPVEKLPNVSKEVIFSGHGDSIPTIDPLTSLSLSNHFKHTPVSNNDDDDDDDDVDDLNKTLNNEWIVIRTTPLHPVLLTNNYPELINYIKHANLRVSQHRQACKSWHSLYWPKIMEHHNNNNNNQANQSVTSPSIKDDHLLELQEKQSCYDLYRTTFLHSSNTTNQNDFATSEFMRNMLCTTRDHMKSNPDLIDHDNMIVNGRNEVNNHGSEDTYVSSPLLLHSLSNQHTSSLYQLNYLNDSSDDENTEETMKQVNKANTTDHNDTGMMTMNNVDMMNTTTTTTTNNSSSDTMVDETINSSLPIDNQLVSNAYSTELFDSTTPETKQPPLQSSSSTTTPYHVNNDNSNHHHHHQLEYDYPSCTTTNNNNNLSDNHVISSSSSASSCTCLSTLPDLLRLAHLDESTMELCHRNNTVMTMHTKPDDDIMNAQQQQQQDYELENFLAALDCLPSPGRCMKHFGHLPPFISYDKIDEEFFKKLDNYLQEFEHSKITTTTTTTDEADTVSSSTSSSTVTTAKNDDDTVNHHDKNDDIETKSKPTLSSSMIRSCTDAFDSISLDRIDSIQRHRQQHRHSDNHSNCSHHSHLTDFSSTSSTQSARHNSNSIGVAGGIGPFLSILLNRMANMHNNCFFTNLLLTDIFAALASYPCPLLYEFLLNPIGLHVKPSVNTLYKVLRSVHSQIVVASESVEQWKSLVFRARVYLNIVWPGPFKMTIDPNFYATKEISQRTKTNKMMPTRGHHSTTNYSNIQRGNINIVCEY